jgi:hypothetical protein
VPRSPIPSSLLSDAVRILFDCHDVIGAARPRPRVAGPAGVVARNAPAATMIAPTRVAPVECAPPATAPPEAPSAYVLGGRAGEWTIDDVLPVRVLLGWRAPPSAWAMVVVASGEAWWVGPEAAAPSGPEVVTGDSRGPGPAVPVGLAVGVDRSGETAGRLRGAEAVTQTTPEGGRLLDTLRRNLGVPTPPAPEGTARFLAVAWLAALYNATSIRPASAGRSSTDSCLGWPAVVRLHPAARLLAARGERLSTAELEGVVEIAPSTWTWDVLRRGESSNGSITALCPPGAASWMDSGMYARWALADLPPTAALWPLARPALTPVARRRFQSWLERDSLDLETGR